MAALEESNPQKYIPSASSLPFTGYAAEEEENPDLVWNVLTVLVWVGMATLILAFFSIYRNPDSRFNLFSPPVPTLAAVVQIPTETPWVDAPGLALGGMLPLHTPEPSATPTAELPTATPTPEPEPSATPGPSPTPTVDSLYPFVLRNVPVAIAGDAIPDHDTCKLWVAGQTYDLQGAPVVGVTVMLGGYIDGKSLYQLSLTGTALQFGQAGYEFTVANQPSASSGQIWVQLFDQELVPLSNRVFLDTYDGCQSNLILVNFRQVR